jgi:hypothetical protein
MTDSAVVSDRRPDTWGGLAMAQEQMYFRVLETALELVAFVRERPDMPEHVVVSSFVFTLLEAIAFELELSGRLSREPSRN